MIYVKFHTFVEELYQKIMGKKFLWLISGLIVITAATTLLIYSLVSAKVPCNHSEAGKLIYIDRDDNADSVCAKAEIGWRWNVYNNVIKYHLRTGCYRIKPGTTYFTLYRQLRNGIQEPVRLIVPSTRTISKLASILSQSLMVDSAEIASALTDSIYCSTYGYTRATIPALFIPNSYEVYWNISVDKLIERMERENNRFWTAERKQKAEACGLTREQVATLASIVDEETANNGEKPIIAGLYLNRLHKKIPLQADPTVKFAVGDFSLRRILNIHLLTESPYNTYRHSGLPPGPIRIASIAGLDAVLNHARHNYLYMCAKEDFSGTHNFAATLSEHNRNAQRYRRALNKRGIR